MMLHEWVANAGMNEMPGGEAEPSVINGLSNLRIIEAISQAADTGVPVKPGHES